MPVHPHILLLHTIRLGLFLLLGSPLAAVAGELVLEHTAIRKMLTAELFTEKGTYPLLRESECRFAYLDSPEVSIAGGRVRIKTRLTSRLAREVEGGCDRAQETLTITASGRPYFAGEILGVSDIRVDEVSREEYRVLLQAFLSQVLPDALRINLREGLQRILSDARPAYQVEVGSLTVVKLVAENNRLQATLWFAVRAR